MAICVAGLLLLLSPSALSQQSNASNIADDEALWMELNATMTNLSQDMSNFDKANATISYSREQINGVWFNVTNYTAKDGTVLKEYLDENNQTNQTMLIVPEELLTTLRPARKRSF